MSNLLTHDFLSISKFYLDSITSASLSARLFPLHRDLYQHSHPWTPFYFQFTMGTRRFHAGILPVDHRINRECHQRLQLVPLLWQDLALYLKFNHLWLQFPSLTVLKVYPAFRETIWLKDSLESAHLDKLFQSEAIFVEVVDSRLQKLSYH